MRYVSLSLPNPGGGTKTIEAPTGVPTGGFNTIGIDIIHPAINLLFLVGILLALVSILYSGIQWIISTGEKQKVQSARNRIIYSITGLIIILLSFIIMNLVFDLLGFRSFSTSHTP